MASANDGLLVLLSVLSLVTPLALAMGGISATCSLSSSAITTIDSLFPITTTTATTESLYSCSFPAARISALPAAESGAAVGDHHHHGLLQEATAASTTLATSCTAKVSMSPAMATMEGITSQVSSNCSEARTPQAAPYLLSSRDCAQNLSVSAGSTAVADACNISTTYKNATRFRSSEGLVRCTITPASTTTEATVSTTSVSSSCSTVQKTQSPRMRLASWSKCTSLAFTPTTPNTHHTSTNTTVSCSSFTMLWYGSILNSTIRTSSHCMASTSSSIGNNHTTPELGTTHTENSCSMNITILTTHTPPSHRAFFSAFSKNPFLSIISSIDDYPDI